MNVDGFTDLVPIGHGGYATVFRARQTQLGRDVAIKIISRPFSSPEDSSSFEAESRALGLLSSHPNIVDVHQAGVSSSSRGYIVMRLYTRGTMADQIRQTGAQNVSYVVSVGRQLASALQLAHSSGIVHRDVKPENVLLDQESRPILTDFGIAALAGQDGSSSSTHAYSASHAAPEVLTRNAFSPASDQYSLASTLYAMLAGVPAFVATTSAQQIAGVVTEPVPPLGRADVTPVVAGAIARAMAKDPTERFPSVAEFAAALEPTTSGLTRQDSTGEHIDPTESELAGFWSAPTQRVLGAPPPLPIPGPAGNASVADVARETPKRRPAPVIVAAVIIGAAALAVAGIVSVSPNSAATNGPSAEPTPAAALPEPTPTATVTTAPTATATVTAAPTATATVTEPAPASPLTGPEPDFVNHLYPVSWADGVTVHTEPRKGSGSVQWLPLGTQVHIVCRTRGESAITRTGATTTWWDWIDWPVAGYLTDARVNTGGTPPDVELC